MSQVGGRARTKAPSAKELPQNKLGGFRQQQGGQRGWRDLEEGRGWRSPGPRPCSYVGHTAEGALASPLAPLKSLGARVAQCTYPEKLAPSPASGGLGEGCLGTFLGRGRTMKRWRMENLQWAVPKSPWSTLGRFSLAAAAAKSLQSCLTLCDSTDGSPPGFPVPGILLARTLEWVAVSFSNAWQWEVKVKLLSCVWLLATPWTTAYQSPPFMGFSRQEYWKGVPLCSPDSVLRMFHNLGSNFFSSVKGE